VRRSTTRPYGRAEPHVLSDGCDTGAGAGGTGAAAAAQAQGAAVRGGHAGVVQVYAPAALDAGKHGVRRPGPACLPRPPRGLTLGALTVLALAIRTVLPIHRPSTAHPSSFPSAHSAHVAVSVPVPGAPVQKPAQRCEDIVPRRDAE